MTESATQSTGLLNDLSTASVVMIHLNVPDKRLIPKGIQWVEELPPEAKPKHEPGKQVLKGRSVDLSDILADVEIGGYVLTELHAIERRKSFRVSGVLVHEDRLKEGAKRLPAVDRARFHQILEENIWDITIYRNPGENGGNFSIECGNPLSGRTSADSLFVGESDEFEIRRR